MANSNWYFKAHIKAILDDMRIGALPDNLWRLYWMMYAVAKEHDKGGLLPPLHQVAWRCRISSQNIEDALSIMDDLFLDTKKGWLLIGFEDEQSPMTSTERTRRHREAKLRGKQLGRTVPTSSQHRPQELKEKSTTSTKEEEESLTITIGDDVGTGMGRTVPQERDEPFPFKTKTSTPASSSINPGLRILENIVGVVTTTEHLETVNSLITRHDQEKTQAALQESFDAWCKCKTKNGKFYNPQNFGWVDWAVSLLENNHREWEGKNDGNKNNDERIYDNTGRYDILADIPKEIRERDIAIVRKARARKKAKRAAKRAAKEL